MPSDNASFSVLAIGHYPAKTIEVRFRLRSANPAKQLLELSYLLAAIEQEATTLRQSLQAQAEGPTIVTP